MTYNEFIQNIINTRGQWSNEVKNSSRGCERHHIIPECLGGLPKGRNWSHHKNLIWLYPEEHFTAHRLLAEENPDNYNLCCAFWRLCNLQNKNQLRYIPTPEEYEAGRILFSKSFSENHSGENHPLWGKHLSDETKEKIRIANSGKPSPMLGRHHSAETKEKISKSKKANYKPRFGVDAPYYNKHHSDETKKLISENCMGKNKGRIHTELEKEKMKLNHPDVSRSKNPRAKKVMCVETGEIFDCIKDASEKYNASHISISCNNQNRTAGGYHWIWVK